MGRRVFLLCQLMALALLVTQATASVSTLQWRWKGFWQKDSNHKPGKPVSINDLQVSPLLLGSGCFGAMWRFVKNGRQGKLVDCVDGKPNQMFISPDKSIRVHYPKGEYGTNGGAQFYKDFKQDIGNSAVLEYNFKFGKDFNPTKGGKLPGLYGGNKACSGGNNAESNSCFSTRIMWRRHWGGATYMYIPIQEQSEDFCKNCYVPETPFPTCEAVVNASKSGALEKSPAARLLRAQFEETERAFCDHGRRFKKNAIPHNETYQFFFPHDKKTKRPLNSYIRVTQVVTLNTIDEKTGEPRQDGIYGLYINGKLEHSINNVLYRMTDKLQISGLFFSTFMGGNDPTWAPKRDMYADFKDFTISKTNVYAVDKMTPERVIHNAQQAKHYQYFELSPGLPDDVTDVALSRDPTCLNEFMFVDTRLHSQKKISAIFDRSGVYTLCVRGRKSVTSVYIPQRKCEVTVLQNEIVKDISKSKMELVGKRTDKVNLNVYGMVDVGEFIAFSKTGVCKFDLRARTRIQKDSHGKKVIKGISFSEPGTYKVCHSKNGLDFTLQRPTLEVSYAGYCKSWNCNCQTLYKMRSHKTLSAAAKAFLKKQC